MWFYLLGLIHEYLVIINAYNADLIKSIPEDFQYAFPDLIILLCLFYNYKNHDYIEFFCIFSTFFAHIQWYLHNPYTNWPDWWISDKGVNDERHRTEYYDTHVMCFAVYLELFFRLIYK